MNVMLHMWHIHTHTKGGVVFFTDVTQLRILRWGGDSGLSGEDPNAVTCTLIRRKQKLDFTFTEVDAATNQGIPAAARKYKRQGTNSSPRASRESIAPPTLSFPPDETDFGLLISRAMRE